MKEEVREKTINGITFESSSYSFTDSEKANITKCLPREQFIEMQTEKAVRENPEISVDNIKTVVNKAFESCSSMFLADLKIYCETFIWRKAIPGRARHREDLQDMQKSFRSTMRYLEKIYKNKLSIPAERSISPNMEMFVSNLVRQHTVEDSLAAYKTLESLCTVIDGYIEEKMERGAPQRETTDLAFEIAEAYRTAFGVMPTTNNCGYFAKIFDTVMDIVSPKDEPGDYSRAIKAAIQSLKPL